MISIRLFIEEQLIAEAKNIKLDYYYSTSLIRKFSFFDVQSKQQNLLLEIGDKLLVSVEFLSKKEIEYLNEKEDDSFIAAYFELRVYNIDYADTKLWTIEGLVIGDQASYYQGVVDVYNYWKQGKELQWNQLPKDISILDYINACHYYSAISEITPEKEVFEIDFKYIKTELEFVCSFAEEFLGKRSYMGRYLDTFDDCLLTLYKYRKKYFNDKYIKLKYKNILLSNELLLIINDAEKILNRPLS